MAIRKTTFVLRKKCTLTCTYIYIPYRILCFEMFPYRGRCTNRSFHLVTNTAKNKDCEILFSIVDISFLNTIFELKLTIE